MGRRKPKDAFLRQVRKTQKPLAGALVQAIELGMVGDAPRLLKDGASPDDVNPSSGRNALQIAICFNHPKTATLLLAHGADMEHQDKQGCRPLMLAAYYGHLDIMRALLKKGVDINAQDENGQTALHHAVESSQIAALALLVESFADLQKVTARGIDALALARKVKSEAEDDGVAGRVIPKSLEVYDATIDILQRAPATQARLREEHRRAFIRDATVLQRPLTVQRLKLKKR